MTAANKRYSYSRIMVIRIDVHLAGENLITRHMISTLDPHRLLDHTSHVVHIGNLLLVPMRSKHAPTPGRNLDDQRQTGLAVALGHLIRPPSR
jgi:hypothetical protein